MSNLGANLRVSRAAFRAAQLLAQAYDTTTKVVVEAAVALALSNLRGHMQRRTEENRTEAVVVHCALPIYQRILAVGPGSWRFVSWLLENKQVEVAAAIPHRFDMIDKHVRNTRLRAPPPKPPVSTANKARAYGWEPYAKTRLTVNAEIAATVDLLVLQEGVPAGTLWEAAMLSLAEQRPPTAEEVLRYNQAEHRTKCFANVCTHLREFMAALSAAYNVNVSVGWTWLWYNQDHERRKLWLSAEPYERALALGQLARHPKWNTAPLATKEALWRLEW